jgi:hypothetical protein
LTCVLFLWSSSPDVSEVAPSRSELPNTPCSVDVKGMPKLMPLCVSAASSSSLDESTTIGFGALLELPFELLVVLALGGFVGVAAASFEAVVPIVVAGEDFATGEKLILVWRLRSRVFLGAMFAKSQWRVLCAKPF